MWLFPLYHKHVYKSAIFIISTLYNDVRCLYSKQVFMYLCEHKNHEKGFRDGKLVKTVSCAEMVICNHPLLHTVLMSPLGQEEM